MATTRLLKKRKAKYAIAKAGMARVNALLTATTLGEDCKP
jgi:hypothetical protein